MLRMHGMLGAMGLPSNNIESEEAKGTTDKMPLAEEAKYHSLRMWTHRFGHFFWQEGSRRTQFAVGRHKWCKKHGNLI